MADPIIDNRRQVRERLDLTALHKTPLLDATTTVASVRLDIVAQKLSIQLDSGLTATAEGSIDGSQFFSLGAFAAGKLSYGAVAADFLVKWVKVTRSAGSGKATIIAV